MRELIERLEKAEAGSRELDAALWYALVEKPALGEKRDRDMIGRWPAYTTSLDSALALVERVLPDHDWSVGCLPVSDDADHEEHHHFGALLYSRYTKPYDALGHGATPPLALCIAILRALRTTEQHSPAQQKKEG